mgnify:CR=1 FL=1
MRAVVLCLGLCAALAAPAAEAGPRDGPTEPAYLYRAEVVRVIDGDTIVVDIDLGFYTWLHEQRIRLSGIDAPPARGAQKAAGIAATDFLKSLVDGREIIIRTFKASDRGDAKGKYGRWLGRIYVDGLDVNQRMIDAGHAVPYDG